MRFDPRLTAPGCADGEYTLHAPGYAHAGLFWADSRGPLENRTAFAYLALDESGDGRFVFAGQRAIPFEATHAAACLTAPDRPDAFLLAPLPAHPEFSSEAPFMRIGVMSDLHLSSKPWRVRKAMRLLKDTDCVLIAGDMTNDGLPAQLERFYQLIEEELPGVPVLAVTGNHDYPVRPLPLIRTGIDDYHALQEKLLERALSLGASCLCDASGAYHARLNGCSFFGLNAVSHFRRFVFPDGKQLDFLRERLRACTDARRFILCHAPLQHHNPNAADRLAAPYLSRDGRIQSMIDEAGSVMFISGHTHVSLNDAAGCIEHDAARGNIYLNDSSVTRTALSGENAPSEWTDGAVVTISLYERHTEITARSVSSGRIISRGLCRFAWPNRT
ncbi:MAG: metallophosphoesterase family protein [Clostridia bacterium]|nr:metallophosphoesterase family protein [Clostridia bacterium]